MYVLHYVELLLKTLPDVDRRFIATKGSFSNKWFEKEDIASKRKYIQEALYKVRLLESEPLELS